MNKVPALLLGAALAVSLSVPALAEEAVQKAVSKPKAAPVEVQKPKSVAKAVPVEVKKPDAPKKDRAAGKPVEPAAVEPKGAAKKTAKGKAVAPADTAATSAKEQETVLASFETFARDWIAKSNRNFQASALKKQIVQTGNGWLARYQEIDGSTMELDIQRTGLKTAPFTGTLKYMENTWECSGQDRGAAENGQFACVKAVRITEIFRYQNNVWKY